jgi:hypothetical protein
LSIQEAKSWTEKMGDQEKTGDQVKIVRTEENLNKNSCADVKFFLLPLACVIKEIKLERQEDLVLPGS